MTRPRITFFGSSLVSVYRNGAATYCRGVIRALHARGYQVTFYEPDAPERQGHRDLSEPDWARVVVYPPTRGGVAAALDAGCAADIVIKSSGVGLFDAELDAEVLARRRPGGVVIFWDLDAPATLDRMQGDRADPLLLLIPQYDLVLTHGGGDAVVSAYKACGARDCVPIHGAVDPETHHPVDRDARFRAHLGFLGNRLRDREARVEAFFLRAAEALPQHRFLLGGIGWDDKLMPANVLYVGYVSARDHNAFNCSPLSMLAISRECTPRYGFSPSTRLFEAAGTSACPIADDWPGLDTFLEPGREVLVARDGLEVAQHVRTLTPDRVREIGRAARARVLGEHTYAHRVEQMESLLALNL
jgi:spore maturation protein CgeB